MSAYEFFRNIIFGSPSEDDSLPDHGPDGRHNLYSTWLGRRIASYSPKAGHVADKVVLIAKIALAAAALIQGVRMFYAGYIKLSEANQPVVDMVAGMILTGIAYLLVNPQESKQSQKQKNETLPKGLTSISQDIALHPEKYVDIVGREEEIKKISISLLAKQYNNIILVGPAGSGKTTLVYQIAKKIHSADPEGTYPLKGKRIYKVDLNKLVSGTIYRGMLEDNLERIIHFMEKNKDDVFFFDEIHMLNGGDNEDRYQIANKLKEVLSKGVHWIGATTPTEYAKSITLDPALQRRFSVIELKSMTGKETVDLLKKQKKHRFEQPYNIKISDSLVDIVFEKSEKLHGELPDRSIRLMDHTFAAATYRLGENIIERKICRDDIQTALELEIPKTQKMTDGLYI